jgi:hypothetical protein
MATGGGSAHKGGAVANGKGGRFVSTDRLTDAQRRFVVEVVHNGGNGTQAAIAAGYSKPAQSASQLRSLPHVQAAIHEERCRVIGGELANVALGVFREIMADTENAPAMARLRAAERVMEMAGHLGPNSRAANQDEDKPLIEMTSEELTRFIEREEAAIAELRKAIPVTIDGAAEPIPPGIPPGSTIIDVETEAE